MGTNVTGSSELNSFLTSRTSSWHSLAGEHTCASTHVPAKIWVHTLTSVSDAGSSALASRRKLAGQQGLAMQAATAHGDVGTVCPGRFMVLPSMGLNSN